jgi:hypothetical protein
MPQRSLLALAISPLAAGALLFASVAPATAATSAPSVPSAVQTSGLTTAVGGTVNGVAQTGTLTISNFVRQAGQVLAVGNLALGGTNLGTVQVPVNLTTTTGSCPILHLVLGPLDLNLLGLTVHLDQVVLDITAQAAPGNLLGNLLCAVAHLLDNNALGGVTALLNRILGILSGLTL